MKQAAKLFVVFVFLHKMPLSLPQAEEHPICVQHHPSCDHLAHFHCKVTDGSKHLVLCGEPLLQVSFLLQGIQHPQALKPSISNQPLPEGPPSPLISNYGHRGLKVAEKSTPSYSSLRLLCPVICSPF